jgi:hypothetical protein
MKLRPRLSYQMECLLSKNNFIRLRMIQRKRYPLKSIFKAVWRRKHPSTLMRRNVQIKNQTGINQMAKSMNAIFLSSITKTN